MSDLVNIVPLLGGRSDGGICFLLEIGGNRVLLDCGRSWDTDPAQLQKLISDLSRTGGIDAVILSHADIHHIGALPVLLGKNSLLQNVPVICTLPVYKFGQLVLYDAALNLKMEGKPYSDQYGDFDDIDQAWSTVTSLKFHQKIDMPVAETSISPSGKSGNITVCAFPSGRTVGGAIWQIRCGPTEILYATDVNLKRELVLDGVKLNKLPIGSSILITDSGAHLPPTAANTDTGSRRGTVKDDVNSMLQSITDTLRNGGNVLIPCETVSRTLELMQVVGKYWFDRRFGMYSLIFLSHMGHNVMDFARMQLEWMSDTLSRGFYNGKPNPFDLPQLNVVTTVKEMEKKFPGPKLVFVTDVSLSYGLSKELLLKWGGNPRNKVIFVDYSDKGSLAQQLREKINTPPIVVEVIQPVRVELTGEELEEHRKEVEKQRREIEGALQRKRRQEELSKFGNIDVGEEEGELEENNREEEKEENKLADSESKNSSPRKRKLPKTAIERFVGPEFAMFETKEIPYTFSDFGMSNEDLQFKDIQSIELKWTTQKEEKGMDNPPTDETTNETTNEGLTDAKENQLKLEGINEEATFREHPWKLVPTKVKFQFTCDFMEFNLGSRADLSAIKTIVSKLNPERILVARGSYEECLSVGDYSKTIDVEPFIPKNKRAVSFNVHTDRLQIKIPQTLLDQPMKTIQTFSTDTNTLQDTKCAVAPIMGYATEVSSKTALTQEGVRVVKYHGKVDTKNSDQQMDAEPTNDVTPSLFDDKLALENTYSGLVSVGEIKLNSLKPLIEAVGIPVEIKLVSGGIVLVCAEQVLIRKKKDSNDFVIEGPPIPAFYEARKALYKQYQFV